MPPASVPWANRIRRPCTTPSFAARHDRVCLNWINGYQSQIATLMGLTLGFILPADGLPATLPASGQATGTCALRWQTCAHACAAALTHGCTGKDKRLCRAQSAHARNIKTMANTLYRGDLPSGLDLGPVVAIDCETMGLVPARPALPCTDVGADGNCQPRSDPPGQDRGA